jgi:hypothetical protein
MCATLLKCMIESMIAISEYRFLGAQDNDFSLVYTD